MHMFSVHSQLRNCASKPSSIHLLVVAETYEAQESLVGSCSEMVSFGEELLGRMLHAKLNMKMLSACTWRGLETST